MDFVLPSKNLKHSQNRMVSHKEFEKNESKERKRSLLHLIWGYLRDCNLHETADQLASEAQLINQYELCDNIDLDIIFQDFQSYYSVRFNKSPKIIKRVAANAQQNNTAKQMSGNCKAKKQNHTLSTAAEAKATQKESSVHNLSQMSHERSFHIDVTGLGSSKKSCGNGEDDRREEREKQEEEEDGGDGNNSPGGRIGDYSTQKTARPSLCEFEGYCAEWREMADLITREIVSGKSAGFSWSDCVGADRSIRLLKEAVVYPRLYPQLFKGLLTPWKGVLLFGPPGTGKTLLAKALAAESDCPFINLAISTFVSKWRGESEKMLRVLFDVARLYKPCIVFIDELDALASKYEDHQHDASRRFKSELLVQMDGLSSETDGVFILATTNSPWNLCTAILRRFEKRILLNVPDAKGRAALFRYYFDKQDNNQFTGLQYEKMAAGTEGFSGADIKIICREVAMSLLREKLQFIRNGDNKKDYKLRQATIEDVKIALEKYHPSVQTDLIEKYSNWEKSYGSL